MKQNASDTNVKEMIVVLLALFVSSMSAIYSVIWLWHEVVLVTMVTNLIVTVFVIRKAYADGLKVDWRGIFRKYWYFLPFVGYSFISIFWSIQVDISIYRWVILICAFIMSWYFGQKHSGKTFQSYILVFSLVIVLATIAVTISDLITGMQTLDPLRGFFWHRNHTGLFLTFLGFISLITVIRYREKKDWRFYSAIMLYALSIYGVILTKSVSSIFTSLILHGMIPVFLFWLKFKNQIKKWHYYALAGIVIIGLIFSIFNLDLIFGVFGRQANLTGRVPMWRNTYNLYFLKHPVFGYGFNAFWYQTSHRLVIGTVSDLPPIVIADNGFFDILISGGVVGFFLFLVSYVALWVEPVRAVIRAKTLFDCVPFMIMVMIFFGNLTWSMLFENESFYLLVMLTIHFRLTRDSGSMKKTSEVISVS